MTISRRAKHGAEEFTTEQEAIEAAKRLATAPRVSAVLRGGDKFAAVPGYIDGDTEATKQIALITPDGKVWRPEPKCRRCSECEGSDHHWLQSFPFYDCKHCEAKGLECPACSGTGEGGDCDVGATPLCQTCGGSGVIPVIPDKRHEIPLA